MTAPRWNWRRRNRFVKEPFESDRWGFQIAHRRVCLAFPSPSPSPSRLPSPSPSPSPTQRLGKRPRRSSAGRRFQKDVDIQIDSDSTVFTMKLLVSGDCIIPIPIPIPIIIILTHSLGAQIFQETDVAPTRQEIYRNGTLLRDHMRLEDADVRLDDVLNLKVLAESEADDTAYIPLANAPEQGFAGSALHSRRRRRVQH